MEILAINHEIVSVQENLKSNRTDQNVLAQFDSDLNNIKTTWPDLKQTEVH